MKYKCEMIRDLLPLYIDEVCSDESRKIVEDHIKECPECASLTDSMRNDEAVNEAEDYESAQVRSLINVRKKQKKNLCILITAGIIIGLLPFLITLMAFGGVIYDVVIKKPSVCTDISKYSYCLDKEKDGQYFLNESNRRIFPEKIKVGMTVTDFQYVNYNPWDPQIITYLTVKYSDEDYQTELKRLSDIGNEKYEGIYSVTGELPGYDLIAMDADEYYGFV
ncbi:MAG: zf-HC2 domain-containing protein, partial [Oscillospiraceae bacterium]|nr:zf-HC2 domain-containing protein [Oscillospiraceae bacterium]